MNIYMVRFNLLNIQAFQTEQEAKDFIASKNDPTYWIETHQLHPVKNVFVVRCEESVLAAFTEKKEAEEYVKEKEAEGRKRSQERGDLWVRAPHFWIERVEVVK